VSLPEAYSNPPRVRANLVQGRAAIFVDENGSSRGLSNPFDLERLLALRQLSDVVVTDGETARLEKYTVPRSADLAVITRLGFQPAASVSKHKYIELIKSPTAAIEDLLKNGYERVLSEAGPNLVRSLISADLVDELCLTNTNGSQAQLEPLGIESAKLLFSEVIGDTTFTLWGEIQSV
jgi:riboflavin biosynthesis pyrimidine reductase